MVPVMGHAMRVRTAGLADRQPGRPVIVLETGAVQSIDTWAAYLQTKLLASSVLPLPRYVATCG